MASTPRQKEVLDLLCEGKAPAQIARMLHLSESTVRQYVRQLIERYRAQSTQHLVCIEWAQRARCECRAVPTIHGSARSATTPVPESATR